jgi:hypothetical protein
VTIDRRIVSPGSHSVFSWARGWAVAGTKSAQQGAAVGAAEMVALSAAAVKEDRFAAMGIAHRLQTSSAGLRRFGSGPGAGPCCRCSRRWRRAPCRRGSWQSGGRRSGSDAAVVLAEDARAGVPGGGVGGHRPCLLMRWAAGVSCARGRGVPVGLDRIEGVMPGPEVSGPLAGARRT